MGQLVRLDSSAPRRTEAVDWALIASQLIVPHLSSLSYERLVVAGFDHVGRLHRFDDSAGQMDCHAGLLPALRRALAPASVTTILIAHNHPTGNARASAMDWQSTRQAAALCRLAGVTLVDHWIIAGNTMVRLFDDDTETAAPAMSIDACQR
jgi:DNA repair protein RadC